jgi:CBS domain-containing protein
MQVQDVMTTTVVTTTADTPLRDAVSTLVQSRISGMPVVSSGGEVVGVISEADVLAKERRVPDDERGAITRWLGHGPNADPKHEARTVGEAMSAPAVVVPPYVSVSVAAGRMLEHGVNRLPVVDGGGRLIGIVSRADLVRAFVRSDEAIAADAREQIEYQQALAGDNNAVGVEVSNGDVVLTGAVRRRSDAAIIPQIVRHVPGVVEVRADLSWSESD